jgi:hypothetical protein
MRIVKSARARVESYPKPSASRVCATKTRSALPTPEATTSVQGDESTCSAKSRPVNTAFATKFPDGNNSARSINAKPEE